MPIESADAQPRRRAIRAGRCCAGWADKAKLERRVARIRGQMDAVARALETGAECGEVLRLIASARGAMNGLMAEVLEDHIRHHAFRGTRPGSSDAGAADDVVDVIRSYLK